MNHIYRTNLKTMGLLSIVLSASMVITGCNTTAKEEKSATVKALSQPSLVYLADANPSDFEAWMTVAKSNYDSKNYARALRAANEALKFDKQAVEARQIAMLSSIKLTENNISAYHNDSLMDSSDKAMVKNKLTNITTLIQTSN
ncbi:tetratricopeptide repeat protein [Psychrobacter fjordensis]|uniref:hypothetical protein n=1 Tax=Psychrobacter fjordensis TaxID=664424 RepID=UPI001918613A|nr:hypothetical protein [Psychrobacter fjordensis]